MSAKTVIKRGGTKENFNVDKIKNAIKSAFKAIGEEVPDEVYKRIDETDFKDNLSVEDIQDIVEDYLMDVDHLAAKMFILYRETHKQARLVRSRLDYMQEYAYNNENAASSSETDANSNVSVKNVANLEGEVYKLLNRTVQRQRMKDELNKLYPNSGLGHQYIKDLRHHILYQHDESSTPVLKFYTYSPYECVHYKYNGVIGLSSLKSLYNLVLEPEIPQEGNEVWSKFPENLYVEDSNGFTKVTRLTRKSRYNDLVRVKTAFGEDLIVTANHPLIKSEDKEDKVKAKDSEGYSQKRLKPNYEFKGVNKIDLASCVNYDEVHSNYILTHETNAPYFYTKRFISIDRSLGYVIGFFIGDGNYDNTFNTIMFSQRDKKVLEKLAEKLFESFGVVSYIHQNTVSNMYSMKICSTIVSELFRNYFKIGDKAQNKNIPYNIFEFNSDFVKGIVEGIIDSDGTIENNGASVNIRLSSRECIMQLTMLLKYFGYGVANTMNEQPFGTDTDNIHGNYTVWGIVFSNTPDVVKFDGSEKWRNLITREITKGLKYSEGWSKITNVSTIKEGAFLDSCAFIYDITTETHTLKCNNLWVHNCQADSLYPLMTEGVGNIDGVTPTPPNDLESFCGQMRNLVFLLSSQCKGATAYAGYNVALAYYIRTEFGPQWYNKLDVTYTNEHVIKQHTIRHRIAKAIKDFIWSINQPAGNRSFNSPFTNISWFDKYYFQAMYGDFYYPDGTKPKWEEVDVLQRMEMQILRELRLITPLTFPVTTTSLLYDEKTKEFKDPEYYHLACEEYAKGGSFFTYMNSNPASLASCCRVLNEMEDNTFSSTTGMNGEMTGSCNVMTLNLNRIIQDYFKTVDTNYFGAEGVFYKDITEEDMQGLKEYLCKILERVYKYQIAFKTMLYDMEDKGMFAASNGNYIYMKKLYSTIGVIGYMEAAEFLGLEIGYNENYTNFLEFILSTIRDENKKHSILDKKRPFKFNTEAIPGENLGVKLYNWDKDDGYVVTEGRERYSCYFFNPWDNNISALDKLKLHGGKIAKSTDGGEACHINLDAHLSESQYEKLLQYAAQVGCNYFTFNIPMSKCDDCGHVVNAPISKCPKCDSTHITYYTRIIGYLTAVKNWSDPMQKEFTQRIFTDKTIGEIVKSEEQNSDK